MKRKFGALLALLASIFTIFLVGLPETFAATFSTSAWYSNVDNTGGVGSSAPAGSTIYTPIGPVPAEDSLYGSIYSSTYANGTVFTVSIYASGGKFISSENVTASGGYVDFSFVSTSAISELGLSSNSAFARPNVTGGYNSTQLSAPTNVSAVPADGSVTISWSPVSGASSYYLYEDSTKIETVSGTSISVPLSDTNNHAWSVAAVDGSGNVGITSSAVYAAALPPITAPTGLTVASGADSLVVKWSPVNGATSYNVYDSGVFAGKATGTSLTLTGLSPGSVHSITVTAANSGGESDKSTPVSGTVLPEIPTGLSGVMDSSSSAKLSWSYVSGADSYNVYNAYTGVKVATVSGTSYEWTGLSSGTQYTWQVSAVANGVEGQKSDVTTVQPEPVLAPPTSVHVTPTSGGGGTVTFTPDPSAPSGTTYTVYDNGQPVGTTTGSTVTVNPYDPNGTYTVTASAPGYASSAPKVADGTTGGALGKANYGISASDVFTNSVLLISSFGGLLLLILAFIFAPKLTRFVRSSFGTNGRESGIERDLGYRSARSESNGLSYAPVEGRDLGYRGIGRGSTTERLYSPVRVDRTMADTSSPTTTNVRTDTTTRTSTDTTKTIDLSPSEYKFD